MREGGREGGGHTQVRERGRKGGRDLSMFFVFSDSTNYSMVQSFTPRPSLSANPCIHHVHVHACI